MVYGLQQSLSIVVSISVCKADNIFDHIQYYIILVNQLKLTICITSSECNISLYVQSIQMAKWPRISIKLLNQANPNAAKRFKTTCTSQSTTKL